MATATAEKKAGPADLAAAIGDEDAAVADVLALVGEGVLARAWAAGDVEFGRQSYCVTGRPGVPESRPTLIVESGVEWTGPKTARHKRLAGVLADAAALPDCKAFKKYVQEVEVRKDVWERLAGDPLGRETRWATADITRDEAAALLALRVRLTDKGLAGAA